MALEDRQNPGWGGASEAQLRTVERKLEHIALEVPSGEVVSMISEAIKCIRRARTVAIAPQPDDSRKTVRLRHVISTTYLHDGKSHDCGIYDLSAGGARIGVDTMLETGIEIALAVPPDLSLSALVVRSSGTEAHLSFRMMSAEQHQRLNIVTEDLLWR
jgi:hypothetical protein